MFVIVDGIDGSGKGTIVSALAETRRAAGARVFDLREFAKREHRLPEPEEITGQFDVIVSAEPTHAWIGSTIRDEIVRDNSRDYGALRTAEAFALDRLILYRRVLLPAREHGIDIIQERSVTSSLVYQSEPTADRFPREASAEWGRQPQVPNAPLVNGVSIDVLCTLPGNAFALAHPPDCCIIVSTEPARAVQRLQLREKRDAAVFEKLPILEQLHARYQSPWFRELLKSRGWHIADLDANGAVEDAVAQARTLFEQTHRTLAATNA